MAAGQSVAFQTGEATGRAKGERSQAVNTAHVALSRRGNGSTRNRCGGSHTSKGHTQIQVDAGMQSFFYGIFKYDFNGC